MITITDATVDQASIVHRIMLDAFEEYRGVLEPPSGAHIETVEDVINEMQHGGAVIAWLDDEAIGSGRWRIEPEGYLYIGRVSVLPAFRGRGAARAMLEHMEQIARQRGITRLRLVVRMLLPQNIEMYRKQGYEIAEIIKHPRGNTEVVYMEKQLTNSD
ncbi:MAG: GNAT family N-acetyltransferase [Chloroflexi bacterium]|uniref:GNAT family N-acetyltransferase n=1 Tax=Candidatus Flexifilum breve TaxID=3140694 RepID=UPI003135587C|nr:GNAT family N-acetyltransferase [Chloroflexota bacterium]